MDSPGIAEYLLLKEEPCELNDYGTPKTIVAKSWVQGKFFFYPFLEGPALYDCLINKVLPDDKWMRVPYSKIIFSHGK